MTNNSAYDYIYRMHRPLGSYWPTYRHIYGYTRQQLIPERLDHPVQDEPPPPSITTPLLQNDLWRRITGPQTMTHGNLYLTTYQPTRTQFNPFNPLQTMQLRSY